MSKRNYKRLSELKDEMRQVTGESEKQLDVSALLHRHKMQPIDALKATWNLAAANERVRFIDWLEEHHSCVILSGIELVDEP